MSKTFVFIIGNNQDIEFNPISIHGDTKFCLVNTPQISREELLYKSMMRTISDEIDSIKNITSTNIRNMFILETDDETVTIDKLKSIYDNFIKNSSCELLNGSSMFIIEVEDMIILPTNV